MTLIHTGSTWQFQTESDLEEVVWRNLPKLLNLEPISRQFSIDGKFCDILATEPSGRLVIIELKNTEDRYVVQQLTRYYDVLKTTDSVPFSADTDNPRLIAIAPSFHADTLIDCRYSTLTIELFTFRLEISKDKRLSLILSNAAGDEVSALLLPNTVKNPQRAVPIAEPPRKLLNWLSHSHSIEYDWLLELREQLLGADSRMRETVEATEIIYGKGKSKPCCALKKVTKKMGLKPRPFRATLRQQI